MLRSTNPRLLVLLATGVLALHVVHDLTGFGGQAFAEAFALWFQPAVFAACGLATLGRALTCRKNRMPWWLIGAGLVLYAAGSVAFNLELADDASPPFPSMADALWLSLYPFVFAGLALLVHRRFHEVGVTVWLDGLIAGTLVAALMAAAVFEPVFAITVENGTASLARLAYPVCDLIPVGFVVVVWCLNGRRLEPFWALIGAGFALLALSDSVYVVSAARGDWAPGGALDLSYALGTMCLAAAAWHVPSVPRRDEALSTGAVVSSAFSLTAVALVAYGVVAMLNPVAVGLTLLTLLVVVIRFGLTLAGLTRQSNALAALAASDPLTGLANHRTLHERLTEEVDRARRSGGAVSVVALDIDHFKAINDTYGHSEGDAALQSIAGVLSAQARVYDVVGRVGGEEFALVLPGADSEKAYTIAERCRTALARLEVHGNAVSCSAGVASFPEDDDDGNRLFELADGALYWAKQSGRAQTKRYDPRNVVLLSSAEQQRRVREALERPDALTAVFQPIVELTTGRIRGYEALARFLHTDPVRPPDHWFALARRCGLGPALEARALEVALAVPGRPPGTFLSLNLSPAALLSPEVARVLPDDLGEIVIELTEDELFTTDEALDLELAALRSRGARIAVDDAGAGYAGLQQLIRIRPEILKLDRSLVQQVDSDGAKIALVEALAGFAASTGAAVCAEGIEEVEELQMLARFDVMYGQGYVLGRPGPAWPRVIADAAGQATSEERWGMRIARAATDGHVTLGEVADALARVASREDLDRAVALVGRLVHADSIVVSKVLRDERCVETLADLDSTSAGERFSYEDYPTTERVIVDQMLGQVLQGDPSADPAEVRLLEELGYGAVLMGPIVFRTQTVGLLEFYRRTARPWTTTEIDQARVLAHHLGAAIGMAEGTPA